MPLPILPRRPKRAWCSIRAFARVLRCRLLTGVSALTGRAATERLMNCGVVILSYGGSDVCAPLIEQVAQSECGRRECLVVSHNPRAPGDRLPDTIQRHATVIENGTNLGYAGGM